MHCGREISTVEAPPVFEQTQTLGSVVSIDGQRFKIYAKCVKGNKVEMFLEEE